MLGEGIVLIIDRQEFGRLSGYYRSLGFEIEGLLKQDRILSDGKYYSTYMMARYIE